MKLFCALFSSDLPSVIQRLEHGCAVRELPSPTVVETLTKSRDGICLLFVDRTAMREGEVAFDARFTEEMFNLTLQWAFVSVVIEGPCPDDARQRLCDRLKETWSSASFFITLDAALDDIAFEEKEG